MDPNERDKPARRSETNTELQDARPLIQAVCLGLALAVALTAAAAMANQDLETMTNELKDVGQVKTTAPTEARPSAPHL
ncbi:MAG: hypothetical protein ABJN98_20000 [Roseibium sp.]